MRRSYTSSERFTDMSLPRDANPQDTRRLSQMSKSEIVPECAGMLLAFL